MHAESMPRDPRPRPPVWLTDALLILLMVPLTLVQMPGAPPVWPSTLVAVLLVIAAALLPLRRRRPLIVLGALIVVYGVAAIAGTLAPGLAFAIAVGMSAVTDRMPRKEGLWITGVTLVLVIALGIGAWIGEDFDPRLVQFLLIIVVGSALGDAHRSRREYIAAITERAERAERERDAEAQRRVTEERLRIARDLHDAVAHQISLISLNAGVASAAVEANPEKAKESLASIRSASRTVLGEIGALLNVLRADDDPVTSPGPSLAGLDGLVDQFRTAGLDVTLRVDGDLSAVGGSVGTVAYRVVQEALTNAHKHGAEHRAHVLLDARGDELEIVVTNPVADAPRTGGSGLGLVGMRERVSTVRGSIEVGLAPGGWRVTARMPLAVNTQEGPA